MAATSLYPSLIPRPEHIKYPDPKGTNNVGQPRRPQQPGQLQNGAARTGAMSPPLGSDTDDSRHEPGVRVKSPPNGGMQPFPNQAQMTLPSAGGKRPPTRPPRDEQGAADLGVVRGGLSDAEDPRVIAGQQQQQQQRGIVPLADVRSRSPTNNQGRVMSPQNGAPSIAHNVAAINSRVARSPSPPGDAFVYPSKGPNGMQNVGVTGRISPMGHTRPGSQSNIAADLMRDLRSKDAELETLRRRETWMRAALSKASKAGFSWSDLPIDGGDGDDVRHETSSEDARRLVDLAFRLKQERATLQVCF